ncbi:MAG: hypothetical protein Q9Q13_06540, partial [Acidobacteriota bacterium]|nr:hypothetical protein [Acidobacteriota bacterium]
GGRVSTTRAGSLPEDSGTPAPAQHHRQQISSLARSALGRQEIFRWKAEDGMPIEGPLIHPLERRDGGRVPLIVVAHGGPESHWVHGWLTRYRSPAAGAAGAVRVY